MTENKVIDHIKRITSTLLKEPLQHDEVVKNINEIHSHFKQITEITGYDTNIEHLAAIPTAKGSALGLNYAAQCLVDYKRTVKFLKGIIAAIKEKQAKHPGELIQIFYAGCGPYATLFTLTAPHFTPEEVQFTLLEINENSVDVAKKLIHSLELDNYVQEFYVADAVTFKIPNPTTFHMVISETLDALLYRECYVPIVFNLLSQVRKDVTLIPENVVIEMSLIKDIKEDQSFKEKRIETVLDVRNTITHHGDHQLMPAQLPDKEIDLSVLDIDTYEGILLDTKVHVYHDIWLDRNESSLTLPLNIALNKPVLSKSAIFTYYLEPEIELKCTFQ
ncbi:phytanoyl-CoA dioxygenase [uncultured Dokdonia sp.]|uniref:phytanoyl-CoA dioxygenase n=1 Tax=uncultured Dokdonia sp. TaxID=575653 RepID=UPI0026102F80|nr:phytanoyl-CoA dioxygenase [uncultured Dokdonia sp.]